MNSLKILNTISNAIVSIISIFAISKYTHIIENIEILPIKTVDITFFLYLLEWLILYLLHTL